MIVDRVQSPAGVGLIFFLTSMAPDSFQNFLVLNSDEEKELATALHDVVRA